MADKFSKAIRGKIMSKIRGKNTSLEVKVFDGLKKRGLKFKKHYKKIRGTPDIAFPDKKLAVFVDGDFWHGYRFPAWKHKVPKIYWQKKIETNRRRDKNTFAALRRSGWSVVRIWGHEIARDADAAFERVSNELKRHKK
jgi:DNA mismatch endonuclease, patch repair protein